MSSFGHMEEENFKYIFLYSPLKFIKHFVYRAKEREEGSTKLFI